MSHSEGRPSESDVARTDVADVDPQALVQIGFVYRAHGMEGELKVNPEHTDDPARYEEVDTVYIGRTPGRVHEHTITSVRYQETKRGTTVILGLSGIASRGDAEAVAKRNVYVLEEQLELGDGEVFVHDLVGLRVVTEAGDELGTVSNYVEMPAQDVFVIRQSEGGEAMIPAVEDFIVDVDVDGGTLVVRPVDGLLD